jgi:NAD(P)-dependent dehydrogenase (short-subunit alcohol dehydrogenase family)
MTQKRSNSTRSTHDRPVVLVTGGAKRLGAEICHAFATAGWRIACHYQQSKDDATKLAASINQAGGDCRLFTADLSDATAVKALFWESVQSFGSVECVINNASVFERDEGVDFTPELFLQHQAVNVLAPLLLGQALAAFCNPQDGVGCVVHVLDQKVDNLNPDYFSYTVSKLALRDSVKLQAQALAPHVRVLGVSPGLIYVSGAQSEANFKQATSINLLKTPTNPAHVAQAIVDLVNNPAINGAILNVDSGQHLVPLGRDVMFMVGD